MRTTPVIGRKAWFGPRRYGWGLSPVSVEGWVTLAVAVAALIVVAITVRHAPWLLIIIVAALLAVLFLKGTSMGGPAEWAEYRKAQDRDRTP